jgi:hypothetical protein
VQRRVLVLRSGLGSARPHSRRGVARLLNLRVRRVVRIEHRGLHKARALSRAGACGGGGSSAGAGPSGIAASGSSGGGNTSALVPAPSKGGDGSEGASDGSSGASGSNGSSSGSGSSTGTGEVRGESETQLPPPLGGDRAAPGGISLAIGIFLILLALLAGFATPHLRGRLGSS